MKLIRNISQEVKMVVWDCEGGKSPGPGGYNLTSSSIVGACLRRIF